MRHWLVKGLHSVSNTEVIKRVSAEYGSVRSYTSGSQLKCVEHQGMYMIRGNNWEGGRQTPEIRWSCVKQALSNCDHDRRGDNKDAMSETLVPLPARAGCCPGCSTSPFAIRTDGEQA